jgi:hypothetical protein
MICVQIYGLGLPFLSFHRNQWLIFSSFLRPALKQASILFLQSFSHISNKELLTVNVWQLSYDKLACVGENKMYLVHHKN